MPMIYYLWSSIMVIDLLSCTRDYFLERRCWRVCITTLVILSQNRPMTSSPAKSSLSPEISQSASTGSESKLQRKLSNLLPPPKDKKKQGQKGSFLLRWPALLWGLSRLATKRLLYHPGLSLLALLGVILAVGLITSAGFFAQAVDRVIMRQEMAEYTRVTKRAPLHHPYFLFLFSRSTAGFKRCHSLPPKCGRNPGR